MNCNYGKLDKLKAEALFNIINNYLISEALKNPKIMKRMELIKPTHVKKQNQKKKTKPKSKKSDFKKDLEWYVNKGSFKKIDRNKLVVYEDGDKPKEQYKSTRKFPLTGWWVFLEKHRNNKWKACLRKMKEQYWEDFVCSGYCKAGQPALDALYNKLEKL